MPFTFSHPALILPLAYLPKKWFSLTGLVGGSVIPDFEYFLRMKIKSDYSHTLDGVFWFDLPLGILLSFLFHNIIRNALFNNSPIFLKARVLPFKNFNWNKYFAKNWLVVVVSILIGTFSHLFWDGFTHTGGYFVNKFSVLGDTVYVFGFQIKILKILQHLSTLLGAIIIAFGVFNLPKQKAVTKKSVLKYWLFVLVIATVITAVRILNGVKITEYGTIIVTIITALILSLTIVPLVLQREMRWEKD